jgi:hypothetical protein
LKKVQGKKKWDASIAEEEAKKGAIIKSEGKSDGPVPEHDNEDVLGREDQYVIF